MSLSRNIGQYNDVKEVLDLTIANGGGRYVLPDYKAAIRWRQRAYMYRKLLREELEAKRDTFGFSTETPYDSILITLEGPRILLTISKMTGVFETLTGDLPVPPEPPKDELELEADRLIRELGGER